MSAVIDDQSQTGLIASIWEEYRSWVITIGLLLISLVVWKIQGGETVFPAKVIESFPFVDMINNFDAWIRPYVQPTTRYIASGVGIHVVNRVLTF